MSDWTPTRWFKVVAPDGSLWAESSNEAEVRGSARPGDQVFQLWETSDSEWRPAGYPDAETRAEVTEYRKWQAEIDAERAANDEL